MGAQGDRRHLRTACTRTVGVMAGFVPRRLCGSVASVPHKRRRLPWSWWSRMSPNLLMRGVCSLLCLMAYEEVLDQRRSSCPSRRARIARSSAPLPSRRCLPRAGRRRRPWEALPVFIVIEQIETRQIAFQNLGSTGNLSICSNICSMACRLYVPAASLTSIGDALQQFDSRQIQVTGARLT